MADHPEPDIIENIPYANDSPLQTLDLCILDKTPSPKKLWVIFIHGGAYRDPLISSTSFRAAQSRLLSNRHVCALASLNYRLSPHPSFPGGQHTARHPAHIADVLAALALLQRRYAFGSRYVLAGHSVGATLALQVAMGRAWAATPAPVTPPVAVCGVEGVYDFPALVAAHADVPVYAQFVAGAFGEAEEGWAEVSPTAGEYTAATWREGRYVLLAHSRGDEMVEWAQVEGMERRLEERGWTRGVPEGRGGRGYEVLELVGGHDQVWEEGEEVARAIGVAVDRVVGLLE